MTRRFELVFFGSARSVRYRRWHATFESASAEAHRVYRELDQDDGAAVHRATIYGPGCGKDGLPPTYGE